MTLREMKRLDAQLARAIFFQRIALCAFAFASVALLAHAAFLLARAAF